MFRNFFISLALLTAIGSVQAGEKSVTLSKDEALGQAQQCIKIITAREGVNLNSGSADELSRMTVEYLESQLNKKDEYPAEYIDCDSKFWLDVTVNLFNLEPKFKPAPKKSWWQ